VLVMLLAGCSAFRFTMIDVCWSGSHLEPISLQDVELQDVELQPATNDCMIR
jgi:hypothetical protein